jgi:hypothetical protein
LIPASVLHHTAACWKLEAPLSAVPMRPLPAHQDAVSGDVQVIVQIDPALEFGLGFGPISRALPGQAGHLPTTQ